MQFSKELLDKATTGDVAAQCELAECYKFGSGTVKDPQKAKEWWEKAAMQKNAYASHELALCYKEGLGVDLDLEKAAAWFQSAANLGNIPAIKELAYAKKHGVGIAKDPAGAVFYLQKAVAQGDTTAQFLLAQNYQVGEGVAKDAAVAVELYTKAAEGGNIQAQNALAECYEKGEGIAKNEKKAAQLYKKSADSGCPEAQLSLAKCYQEGNGVTKNEKTASEWYKRAADNAASSGFVASEAHRGYLETTRPAKKAKKLVAKSIKKLADDVKMYFIEEDILKKEQAELAVLINSEPAEPQREDIKKPLPIEKKEANYKKQHKGSFIASLIFLVLFGLCLIGSTVLMILFHVGSAPLAIFPLVDFWILNLAHTIAVAVSALPVLIILIVLPVKMSKFKKRVVIENDKIEMENKNSLEEFYNKVKLSQEKYEQDKADFPEVKAKYIENIKKQTKIVFDASEKALSSAEAIRACRLMPYEYIDLNAKHYTKHHPAIEIEGYISSKRVDSIKQAISLYDTENKEAAKAVGEVF